jgi:hypothetical protein
MTVNKLKAPWVLVKQLEQKLAENVAQAEKIKVAVKSNSTRLNLQKRLSDLQPSYRQS